MNILYILSSSSMGGATLSFLTLLNGMIEKGHNAFVIVFDKHPEFISQLEEKSVPYFNIKVLQCEYPKVKSFLDYVKYPCRVLGNLVRIYRNVNEISILCKENKIDLIHTNVGPLFEGHYVAKRLNIPHVWHIREYGDLDFNIKIFPSKSYFQSLLKEDFVIGITQGLIAYNNLLGSDKANIIYNGVRHNYDVTYEKYRNKYFLCASRIGPEKGFDQIIRVFEQFHRVSPDWKLIILGKGKEEYVNLIKSQIRQLGLEDSIAFKGHVSNVSYYMKKANALIVASPAEGFGRMTAEACFAGCLVIGRNAAGTKEIIEQTGGLLFDHDEDLLSCMNRVSTMETAEYRNIAIHAQEVAISKFSIEKYIENISRLYQRALASYKGR